MKQRYVATVRVILALLVLLAVCVTPFMSSCQAYKAAQESYAEMLYPGSKSPATQKVAKP